MRCSATTVLPVPGPPSTTSAPREPARMIASWSAWMVPSTSRIRAGRLAAQAGDERGLVVERGVPVQPVRGEHLVPVVADPAAGPAVPAAAGQAHRVGVGRAEERLGRGGAPVDAAAGGPPASVRPSRPMYTGSGSSAPDDAPEAQVEAEPAQGAQPGGQPVDLQVPVQRLPGRCRRGPGARPRGGSDSSAIDCSRRLGDGREVLLVGGDQRRGGLGGEAVGKIERTGRQGSHVKRL